MDNFGDGVVSIHVVNVEKHSKVAVYMTEARGNTLAAFHPQHKTYNILKLFKLKKVDTYIHTAFTKLVIQLPPRKDV